MDLVAQHQPDLVFLDIRMPGLTGIEAAREIARLDPTDEWPGAEVVFITAYDQYAVEAFEQGVIDYVLKPAERERLQLTVERVKKRLGQRADMARGLATRASKGNCRPCWPSCSVRPCRARKARVRARMPPTASPRPGNGSRPQVGQGPSDDSVEDVLFFILRREVHPGADGQAGSPDPKPIRNWWKSWMPTCSGRSHPLDPGEHQGHRRASPGTSTARQLVSVKDHHEKLEVSRSYTHLFKACEPTGTAPAGARSRRSCCPSRPAAPEPCPARGAVTGPPCRAARRNNHAQGNT